MKHTHGIFSLEGTKLPTRISSIK